MTFDFWSLDYIYYPVSGIMWVWHKVFGSFLGPDSALTWVLSVVFLSSRCAPSSSSRS